MARWSSRSLFVFVALSALAFLWASAAPAYQQIVDLPGISKRDYSFNQYAGYVNITSTKHMFYWFVESQRNPSKDPVMVWMNGGPGASSLMGFFTEHGPFRPEPNGKDLSVNPYAWNRIANIIYLEAPVGVGFSYSDDKRDYVTDDIKTVKDNYQFLLNWFELFPEFKSNPFFVTGESYGGHYVPELASLILEGLRNGTNSINMQGVIVGNPGTNNDWYGSKDEFAYITFLYNHALIPQDSYVTAVNACNWTNFLPTCSNGAFKHPSTECKNATATALSFLPQVLDPYDVYSSQCLVPTPTLEQRQFVKRYTPWHPILNYRSDVGFYPCLANYMTLYLNEPSVQTALHVKPTTWKQFGDILYTNKTLDMVPLWYEFATKTTWKNLVFTGDVDSAVPFLDTQKWINCMNLPLVNPWRPWMHKGQTAGIRQDWKGLSFQTLKGCGHMVPYYCPELGFVFFENWLNEIL